MVQDNLPCGLNNNILKAVSARVIGNDCVVRVNQAKVCVPGNALISFRLSLERSLR
jgi:hypothetical protein